VLTPGRGTAVVETLTGAVGCGVPEPVVEGPAEGPVDEEAGIEVSEGKDDGTDGSEPAGFVQVV
jgi:hypothetical protein